jgi:hypothetical protein
MIHYHFPLEKFDEFYLTKDPTPEWKNDAAFTDLVEKAKKGLKKTA